MTPTVRTHIVSFWVPGLPRPGGSKRPVRNPKTGRIMLIESSDKTTRDWRTAVQAAAMRAYDGPLLDGPLDVDFAFYFRRPKNHYGTGRNADRLKQTAPRWPTVWPDTTKLVRSTEDALTSVLWVDDARIVRQWATKDYQQSPGALITVWQCPRYELTADETKGGE